MTTESRLNEGFLKTNTIIQNTIDNHTKTPVEKCNQLFTQILKVKEHPEYNRYNILYAPLLSCIFTPNRDAMNRSVMKLNETYTHLGCHEIMKESALNEIRTQAKQQTLNLATEKANEILKNKNQGSVTISDGEITITIEQKESQEALLKLQNENDIQKIQAMQQATIQTRSTNKLDILKINKSVTISDGKNTFESKANNSCAIS